MSSASNTILTGVNPARTPSNQFGSKRSIMRVAVLGMMVGLSRCEVLAFGAVAPTALALGKRPMRGPRHGRLLASAALSLMLAVPLGGAFAQEPSETAATFNERFSIEQIGRASGRERV